MFHKAAELPHQDLPHGFYWSWNAALLNFLDHEFACVASVRLVWVMEKL